MNKTGISWTDLTWNPVSGCSKVSPGCQNCYAEALSHRWGRSFEVTLHPEKLKEVKKIPPGSKVFINSMSDLFHEKVPFSFIDMVMRAIESRPDVIFQVLTKRPERVIDYEWPYQNISPPLPDNLWLGVSVEMAAYWERIDLLRQSAARTKFISFEPLIGDVGIIDFSYISWAIIGGESGPHHRPMNIEWARNIVKQAQDKNVAIWMKQMGGPRPGGDLEDFPEDLRIRQFPREAEREVS